MSEEPIGKTEPGGTPGHAEQKGHAAPTYIDWGERFHGADSSILGSTAYKACCQCGIELNHRKRFKDGQGRYWCPECNAADHARHQPTPCEDCRTAFPRDQMTEDQGKFICEECLGKRLVSSVEAGEREKASTASGATGGAVPRRSELSAPLFLAGAVALVAALLAVIYFLF